MMRWKRMKRLLVILACAGVPLVTTASCDPYGGILSVFRYDNRHHHGFFDVFVEDDYYYDDCLFFDCYDYYDEIVIYDN